MPVFFWILQISLPGLQPQTSVQVGQRLVQQQHPGHLDQRPGDGHPLLLPAAQFTGLAVQQFLNLYQGGGFGGAAAHLLPGGPCRPFQVLQREQNVLQYRQMRIQGVVLEYHAHPAQFRRQIGHILVTKKDPSGGGLFQAADHVQRGGFAAARWPEQTNQRTVWHLEAQLPNGNRFSLASPASSGEALGDILQSDIHAVSPYSSKLVLIIADFGVYHKISHAKAALFQVVLAAILKNGRMQNEKPRPTDRGFSRGAKPADIGADNRT